MRGALLSFLGAWAGAQPAVEAAAAGLIQVGALARCAGARLGAAREAAQVIGQSRIVWGLGLGWSWPFEATLCPFKKSYVVKPLASPVVVCEAPVFHGMGTPAAAAGNVVHAG